MLHPDKPINSIKDDVLGREEFINTLSTAIKNINTDESLTIGLFGKWGSGKTSIINMLEENLQNEKDILIFKFEPWLYSNTEHLINQFFKEFAKIIKYKDYGEIAKNLGKELETYAKFFDTISYIPEPTISILSKISAKTFKTVGNAGKKWGELKTKTLLQTKKAIETHIKELKKKILIIIDDIDRLTKKEIQQIFQLIKSLGNFPNTIYLVAMDRDIVIEALNDVQTKNGREYLEKIIQVPLTVPLASKYKIHQYLLSELDEIIQQNINTFDKEYWDNIFYSGYKDFFIDIRDINRYINKLKFNVSAIGKEINIVDLIVITAFEVFEPKIYELIWSNIRLTQIAS